MCAGKPGERRIEIELKDMKDLINELFSDERKTNINLLTSGLSVLSRMVSNGIKYYIIIRINM